MYGQDAPQAVVTLATSIRYLHETIGSIFETLDHRPPESRQGVPQPSMAQEVLSIEDEVMRDIANIGKATEILQGLRERLAQIMARLS